MMRMGTPESPARCKTCFYVIEELEEARCPECGREFNPFDPASYTTKPPLLRWTLWFPGLAATCVVAILSTSILVMLGNWGWALWFGVPASVGTLLGYRVPVRIPFLVILVFALVAVFIVTLGTLNMAGVFCGVVLIGVVFGPMTFGMLIGLALRLVLKATNFSQRAYLPAILALLAPIFWGVIEGPARQDHAVEMIETSRVVDAPIEAVWDSVVFFEEVEHKPPLILRIGLAHPLSTSGSAKAVGDVKRCLYDKGHITKQITDVELHQRLSFAVIEQQIGYERDVRLIGGNFAFEAIDEKRTRVTLTTEYRPLLTPRFAWRWGERIAVHTLHNHVLEGMAIKAEERANRDAIAMGSDNKAGR